MSFFDLLSTEPIVRGDEKITTQITKQTEFTCEDCKLYEGCRSPKLRYTGEGGRGILIVGEQPSRAEDGDGSYGSGKEYIFLKNALESVGVDIRKDCYYTTAINCAPTKTRLPTYLEVSACRKRLLSLIKKLRVSSVILVGETACDSLIAPRLSGRISGTPMYQFMGEHIPDQEYKVWLSPVWSVRSLVERKKYDDGNESKPRWERDSAYFLMWKTHLEEACNLSSFVEAEYRDQCITTEDEATAIKWIESALDWDKMSFDYETTGRKPHREGHKIWSVSICDGFASYAFPFFNSKEFLASWKKLMLSSVKKIGQNIAYEIMWTHALLGYYPKNWFWDTMLGQHCLSNQKPTGLKFMVYTEFGHPGYDDDVDAYLKATTAEDNAHGANAINQIHRAPMDKLLLYNALDSLYTYKLAELQEARFTKDQRRGFDFFVESAQTLATVQENGFNLDVAVHAEVSKALDEQMIAQDKKIMSNEVLTQWSEGQFNHQSGPQLSRLLYEVLGIKPTMYTASKKPSVDLEALSTIKIPIVEDILAYRKTAKMKKTYISQYAIEVVDGKVHPYFNINGVDTYRSSSSSPNIQNQPKRDKNAKRLIRSFIKPSKGNRIVEFDYKSLEVIVNCCYSKDPSLVKYIIDPSTDMHRDSAADCFLLKPEEVTKALRNDVKGQFVFAEFYGSYYAQVAADLWETAHAHKLVDHLKDKGIVSYQDFENHIKEAERIMWEDRFPVHNEWREAQWKFYQKKGYVELLTGFRAYGPMRKNNTFNTPVQGSGYHILQWTMNQVNKKVEKLERSRLIGEIHDSCVGDIHPSESDLIDYWYWLYGTQKVREHWDWITVPLTVEKEQSEIDGSWADMKECGHLKGDNE